MNIKSLKLFLISFSVIFLSFNVFSASINKSYSIVEENNKKGLVNEKGKLIIPVQYEDLGWSKGIPFFVNNVMGFKKNNLWGLINIKNQRVANPNYTSLIPVDNKYILASKYGKFNNQLEYGILNTKGKVLVSFKYHSIKYHKNYIIASTKSDKQERYGVITNREKLLLPFKYQYIIPYGKKSFLVKDFSNNISFYDIRKNNRNELNTDSILTVNDFGAVISVNGKKGVLDKDGNVVVEPAYNIIKFDNKEHFDVLPFPNWKLVDDKNQLINTFNYEEVIPVGYNLIKVRVKDHEALVTLSGETITELDGYQIGKFNKGLSIISKGAKKGVIDKNGEEIVTAAYDTIRILDDCFLVGNDKIDKTNWSLLDNSGKEITGPQYHQIKKLNDRRFAVKIDDYWGIIDNNGNKITPCKFNSMHLLPDGNIKVSFNKQEGVIDENGEWIIIPQEKFLTYINKDLYISTSNYCRSAIYKKGKQIYCTSDSLIKRDHDILEIRSDGKKGLIDLDGNRMLSNRYNYISTLQNDTIYTFNKEGDFGIMTKAGKILTEGREFQDLYHISEGFLGVKINDRYGFVDPNGDLRIANRYDSIQPYSEGFAAIKLLGKWGYINKLERLKIQPYYDEVYPFYQGLSIAKKNGKYGLLNKKGDEVLSFKYDSLYRMKNDRFISVKDDEYGLIAQDGREMVFPKYKSIEDLKNGYIVVQRRKKFGVCTNDGVIVIPIIYQQVKYDPYNKLYWLEEKPKWSKINVKN